MASDPGGAVMVGTNIVNNIAATMAPIQKLVTGFAYVLGLSFAFKAIYTLRQYGEAKTMMSSSHSMKEPLVYMFVAAMFIYFPSGLALMLDTAFGTPNILAYTPISDGAFGSSVFGSDSTMGQSLVIIIQTIGIIAFVRGWVLIARSSGQGQQKEAGKGMVHVFGGIFAMNIVLTLQIINNTLFGT